VGKQRSEGTTHEYKIQKNQSGAYLALLEEVLFVSRLHAGTGKTADKPVCTNITTKTVIHLNEGSGSKNIGHYTTQLCETIRT